MRNRALGDWQTPPALVKEMISTLKSHAFHWNRVLEPTCGIGNMIAEVITYSDTRSVIGVEVQSNYAEAARKRFARNPAPASVKILCDDIFHIDLKHELEWKVDGPLLVLGNPPWVTSSELGSLLSKRRPTPLAIRGISGFESITGTSNFDVTEYISLRLLKELSHEKMALAFLMKTSVARRVLTQLHRNNLPVVRAYQWGIDAKKLFGSAADACLLALELDPTHAKETFPNIPVYATLQDKKPEALMGFVGGELLPDIERYDHISFADRPSGLNWRQGPKHDASAVMELIEDDGTIRNRLGELVDVEADYLFPLIKGSMLNRGDVKGSRLQMIVTQHSLADNTKRLAKDAPKLWEYLQKHKAVFDRRRSRIYYNRPAFSMFGVGSYMFSLYKVAVAGFYKTPRFVLVPPIRGRPTIVDDTCYFTPCSSASEGAFLTAVLNSRLSIELMSAIMFSDTKRPVTKRLLQRLDVSTLARASDVDELWAQAEMALNMSGVDSALLASKDLERLRGLEREPRFAGFG